MKEQDMRAVEGMVRCGIDLEGLWSVLDPFDLLRRKRQIMRLVELTFFMPNSKEHEKTKSFLINAPWSVY